MNVVINTKLRALAEKFADLLRKEFSDNLVSIVLFGSVARGEGGRYSDIDLLVIFNKLPAGHLARTKLIEPVEESLEQDFAGLRKDGVYSNLNYLIKTKEEARCKRPLYFDLTRDAVYLYDNDGFFKKIVEDLRDRLTNLGSRCKKAGRVWYWELKPDYKRGEIFEI